MDKFFGTGSSIASKETYLRSLVGGEYGEFTLGINTSKILNEDPKLLLFSLARYKFVSKMFSGFENVLEIGCQEGFGAAIVSQVVDSYLGIDFYIPYIESCNRRIHNQKLSFKTGDILSGPVYESFQGAFALDVLEHIEKESEDVFMKNICSSIREDGVVILGMPSLQSQKYASEASLIGHVNCKTGEQFREFSQRYFRNVFSFSMNDEVLHTGFFPMSHYLFVLCTNRILR